MSPLNEFTIFGAVMLPVNVAPVADIPAVNKLSAVNTFATFVTAPKPVRVALIVYVNPVLRSPDCVIVTLDPALIPIAPVNPLKVDTP